MRALSWVPAFGCYALLVLFMVLEGRLRRGSAARSLEATPEDRGTTRVIGLAFLTSVLAVLVAPILSRLGLGRFGGLGVAWAGVVAMVLGISVRFWANQTLGVAYTRTLKTLPEQRVLSRGPYRLIRHPGYAGVLLMWLGAGVALRNWIVLVALVLILGWAYGRRIRVEEEMLFARLGEPYREYAAHTWRLVPFVY